MTLGARQPHLTRGGRLLALLLVVLLSVSSLVGHAAMDSCADCSATQVAMADHADPDCSACAALGASPLVIHAHPNTLADIFSPAMVEYIAPPPRHPPRS
jgi:hypothetical protein